VCEVQAGQEVGHDGGDAAVRTNVVALHAVVVAEEVAVRGNTGAEARVAPRHADGLLHHACVDARAAQARHDAVHGHALLA